MRGTFMGAAGMRGRRGWLVTASLGALLALTVAGTTGGIAVADEAGAEGSSPSAGYGAPAALADDGEAAPADSGDIRVGDWGYYTYMDQGREVVTLADYYGSDSSITIPATIDGKAVDVVNFFASDFPDTVTHVTFPKEIREIGARCFSGTKVESVTFPDDSQLETLGEAAFEWTPIRSFTMPKGLRHVGNTPFANTLIETITFNDVVEPFYYDNPNVGTYYFSPVSGSTTHTQFVVPSTSQNFKVVDGALMSKDGTVLYSWNNDFGGGTAHVPDGVTTIASNAMELNTSMSSVTFPSSLRSIQEFAFAATGLTSVTVPDSVTELQQYVFGNCSDLTSAVIGDGVPEMGYRLFYQCPSLSQVTVGASVKRIDNHCFAYDDALTSVHLPDSVTEVGVNAFRFCDKLTSVTGGAGLSRIESEAFKDTGLTSFPFGQHLTYVAGDAFDFTPQLPDYMDKGDDGSGYVFDGKFDILAKENYDYAYQVLDLVNQQRANAGAAPLTMDEDLLRAAMQRAAETSIIFEHTRPDGSSCFTASSKMSGENIAAYSSTPSGVMDVWMNSAGHRANILNGSFQSIGIGCVQVSGNWYWVQCFGTGGADVAGHPSNASVVRVVNAMTGTVATSSFQIGRLADDNPDQMMADEPITVGASHTYGFVTVNEYSRFTRLENSCVTWSVDDPSVATVDANGVVTAKKAGTFTLTAKSGVYSATYQQSVKAPAPVTHTVTFNTKDNGSVPSQTVEDGKAASRPADPTAPGYYFIGWFLDWGGTQPYDFSTPVTSDVTLYAKWDQKAVNVTFESNGGSTVPFQITWTGFKPSRPADPTRDGYTFKGWYADAALTQPFDFDAVLVTPGDVKVYAAWEAVSKPDPDPNPDPKPDPDPEPAPTTFTDVSTSDWFYDWVTQAAQAGLMTGMKDNGVFTGKFKPQENLTRAQVATVLCRMATGGDGSGSAGFTDTNGHWAEGAIAWARDNGIVTGYNDGHFAPDANVSRQELATMVWRFAGSPATPDDSAYCKAVDHGDEYEFATDALKWCAYRGILNGNQHPDGSLTIEPKEGALRSQAAKVFVVTSQVTSGASTDVVTYDLPAPEAPAPAPAPAPEATATPAADDAAGKPAEGEGSSVGDVTASGPQGGPSTGDVSGAAPAEGMRPEGTEGTGNAGADDGAAATPGAPAEPEADGGAAAPGAGEATGSGEASVPGVDAASDAGATVTGDDVSAGDVTGAAAAADGLPTA